MLQHTPVPTYLEVQHTDRTREKNRDETSDFRIMMNVIIIIQDNSSLLLQSYIYYCNQKTDRMEVKINIYH